MNVWILTCRYDMSCRICIAQTHPQKPGLEHADYTCSLRPDTCPTSCWSENVSALKDLDHYHVLIGDLFDVWIVNTRPCTPRVSYISILGRKLIWVCRSQPSFLCSRFRLSSLWYLLLPPTCVGWPGRVGSLPPSRQRESLMFCAVWIGTSRSARFEIASILLRTRFFATSRDRCSGCRTGWACPRKPRGDSSAG